MALSNVGLDLTPMAHMTSLPTTIFGAFLLMGCCSLGVAIQKMEGGKVLPRDVF